MVKSLSIRSGYVTVLVVAALAAGLAPAGDAVAQGCFQHIRNLNYNPTNCSAQPEIDRVFRLQAITWKGHEYLIVDEGNELEIRNIDNPLDPVHVTTSVFLIPNVGDSDYDLLNFSVCDDCRYGIANYKAATVLFDLGTGATPAFVDHDEYYDANIVQGGFTFHHGSQQYLIAASLGTNPCVNNVSGLYLFNGVDELGNPLVQCMGGTNGPNLVNGIYVSSASPPVIYASGKFDLFHIYQVHTSPSFGLDDLGNGGIFKANMARGYGASVDEAAGLLAVADAGKLSMYDIGFGSGSAAAPLLMSTKTLSLIYANAVGLRYPVVHVSQQNVTSPPLTFDVSDPSNPVPLDQQFWDPSHAWNSLGDCLWNNHTIFSDDGAAMYLSRYSSLQVIDPTACVGPAAPVANLTLNPQPVFPGGVLTVTNTSLSGDEYATWITDGPSPHGGTVLWPPGGISFSTSNLPLNYTLPRDMASGDVFYAHAAVQTAEHQYDPGGSTPDQIKTVQVFVDRSPEALITITPPAVVTGDFVDLTAWAEGSPAVPGGGDPYAWTVTPPTGSPTSYTGAHVDNVVLDQSGMWSFDLVVQYEHDAFGQPGVPYSASVQVIRDISSVAASFTVSPPSPLYNETITLSSESAAQAGAALVFDWDILALNTQSLLYELAFCDGPGPIDAQCVIPAEHLDPGVYDVRLTLTNTTPDPDDVSVALIEDFSVLVGTPAVDFVWIPTSPQIAQWTGFTITGVPASDIERAEWIFGGISCDGSTSYTCVEPSFPGCDVAAFAYASGGAKSARVIVTTTGGVQQPQVTHTISVQNTGSCDGTCSYSATPASRSFPGVGGVGTVTVTSDPGCPWEAHENAGWILITSGSSGNGPGTVTYQVAPNQGPARAATITVAGRTHTVLQASGTGCSVTVSPQASVYPWQGGDGTVTVSTTAGCGWVASTTEAWITITSPASGTGPASLTFDVARNHGGDRTGLVLVGDSFHTVAQAEVGPCGRGAVPDDGSPENGYGWGDGNFFVQRFTPGVYPYVYSHVCAAFTRASGDSSLDFSVLVFDDDGPGGGPGSLLGMIPASVSGVPSWLGHEFATVDLDNAAVPVDSGSVFIGVGWDDATEIGFYVAADESGATPQQVGYYGNDGSFWDPISTAFPGYRSLMIRADGYSPTDGEWQQMVGSIFAGGNGFGDPWNVSVAAMEAFDGGLYVGTENPLGSEVDYTHDGTNWFLGSAPGFGDAANDGVSTLIAFGGRLYAATFNPAGGTQLWRTDVGGAWTLVEDGGFGDNENISVPSAAVFGDQLVLGTSHAAGCEIWRSSDGVSWSQVDTNGFGSSFNEDAASMAVFLGQLRVGTGNPNGAELWRSADGAVWSPMMSGGFGSSSNAAIDDLAVYHNMLYAGVSNAVTGAQIWRSADGATWTQVMGDGFGNAGNTEFGAFAIGDLGLMASVSGLSDPGTVWQSADGSSWTAVSSAGFANPENAAIPSLHSWADRVWAGTSNQASGCEVWRGGRHPVFEDGFESGGTGAWGAIAP